MSRNGLVLFRNQVHQVYSVMFRAWKLLKAVPSPSAPVFNAEDRGRCHAGHRLSGHAAPPPTVAGAMTLVSHCACDSG